MIKPRRCACASARSLACKPAVQLNDGGGEKIVWKS